jgi:glycosyltransferase involved in cell wall biosynthesis
MKLTVAICTWNRSKLLDQTLTQMQQLRIPAGVDWELLVVNNICTDDTDAVIAAHANRLPIRRLFEPRQGQTCSRNCAVAATSGEYLIWTDDDVLVDKEWLAEYAAGFQKWPEVAFFGGTIEPWFEGTPPDWLVRLWPAVEQCYAVRKPDPGSEQVKREELPFGANFAVRAADQRRHLYDPSLGLKGTGTLRNDETTVMEKMLDEGLIGRWLPKAMVKHYIPRNRQTFSYLQGFYRGQGEFKARSLACRPPGLFGRLRWLWMQRWLCRGTLVQELRYRLRGPFLPLEAWHDEMRKAAYNWGLLCPRRS